MRHKFIFKVTIITSSSHRDKMIYELYAYPSMKFVWLKYVCNTDNSIYIML